MSKEIDKQVDAKLRMAEQDQRCLIAENKNENRILKRRALKGELVNPQALLFARKETWNQLNKSSQALWELRALGVLHSDWTFCCYSAALAYGLAVPNSLLDAVHILSSKEYVEKGKRKIAHHAIGEENVRMKNSMRCTSLERTLFDCTRLSSLSKGLVILDSALRLGVVNQGELIEYFRSRRSGWRGAQTARKVCALASPLAESGGESIARGLMIELGFQIPELQVSIADPLYPARTYRVDFLWRLPGGKLIIGEFDGREKYLNPEMTHGRAVKDVLIDERLRESRISITGARIMRFGYNDLLDVSHFENLLDTFGVPRNQLKWF